MPWGLITLLPVFLANMYVNLIETLQVMEDNSIIIISHLQIKTSRYRVVEGLIQWPRARTQTQACLNTEPELRITEA